MLGLWDSWDDDAFVRDKDTGLFFEPAKLHVLNHKSERYQVRGPLNVPRPPQGYPLLVQAGSSPDGRETAAQFAEAIFSPHLNIAAAKEYYDDVKGRTAKYGRDTEYLKILPGLSVIVWPTEEEANADYEYLQSLIHPVVAREILSTMIGEIDLSGYSLDEPLPDLPDNDSGHYVSILAMARKENLTIRELGMRVAGVRGKNVIKGTPTQVADYMEEWFVKGACDGFTIMPPYIPGALDGFCDLVVPELQRRGSSALIMRGEHCASTSAFLARRASMRAGEARPRNNLPPASRARIRGRCVDLAGSSRNGARKPCAQFTISIANERVSHERFRIR